MGYMLEVKSTPPADEAPPPDDPTGDAGEPYADEDGVGRWAGDVYEEGDETDPADAYASLSGDGRVAWLDKGESGELTGWIRDADDQVYRYSDPTAWAADVDDAGMTLDNEADEDENLEDEETGDGEDEDDTQERAAANTGDPAGGAGVDTGSMLTPFKKKGEGKSYEVRPVPR